MRLFEALNLRVKDVDFLRQELLVRDGKGQKDRVTMLPAAVWEFLRAHLDNPIVWEDRILRVRDSRKPEERGNGKHSA